MSRERDAIELIWKEIESVKTNWPKQVDWCNSYHARIEQILTQMEDLIQEDLEQMESSCRSREIPRVCPLLEEYNKSQEATNTKTFWEEVGKIHHITEALLERAKERQEGSAEGDTLSDSDTYSPI